ncbi:MAG: hypothetical protein U0793_31815 [Gemmataceae bacterium]
MIVLAAASALCVGAALCWLVLAGETWLVCALAIVSLLMVLAALNYIVWAASATAGRPDWRKLPPALRERLLRNTVISRENEEPPEPFDWN